VESILLHRPAVIDAAVVGLPDETLGQRVGGAVVLAEGQQITVVPEILASARQEIAEYKVPEKLIAVAAIPRNSLTKVDRQAVASTLENEQTP
jgi:non-ribosomal peptide synthetase component E (peptide arylation enzyme)